jgi:glycosyltransferase involved in cell wall biosynthesis
MSNPVVSVVVPVYNEGSLLGECLESATRQSLGDIEIIVVDDASSDETSNLIEKFAERDNRIISLSHTVNKGRGESRNTGIAAATGKYIFFLDSDDSLPVNSLQILTSVAEAHNSELVYGKARSRVDVDRTYVKCDLFNISARNYPDILHNHSVWNKLIRRDVLIDSGIRFVPPKYAEDILFSLKLNLFCRAISIVTNVTYNYRWGRQVHSVTKQKLYDAQSNNITAYNLVKNTDDEILIDFMREKATKNIFRNMTRAINAFSHDELTAYLGNWSQLTSDIPDRIIEDLDERNREFINSIKNREYEAAIKDWNRPMKYSLARRLIGKLIRKRTKL